MAANRVNNLFQLREIPEGWLRKVNNASPPLYSIPPKTMTVHSAASVRLTDADSYPSMTDFFLTQAGDKPTILQIYRASRLLPGAPPVVINFDETDTIVPVVFKYNQGKKAIESKGVFEFWLVLANEVLDEELYFVIRGMSRPAVKQCEEILKTFFQKLLTAKGEEFAKLEQAYKNCSSSSVALDVVGSNNLWPFGAIPEVSKHPFIAMMFRSLHRLITEVEYKRNKTMNERVESAITQLSTVGASFHLFNGRPYITPSQARDIVIEILKTIRPHVDINGKQYGTLTTMMPLYTSPSTQKIVVDLIITLGQNHVLYTLSKHAMQGSTPQFPVSIFALAATYMEINFRTKYNAVHFDAQPATPLPALHIWSTAERLILSNHCLILQHIFDNPEPVEAGPLKKLMATIFHDMMPLTSSRNL